MAKEIQLTQGKVAIVDDEDFEYLNQWKWYANNNYAIRSFTVSKSKVLRISMHREIMKPQKGFVIDHLDGNGLNNQKNNLRICTNSQNLMNRVKNINNTSGYKGVRLHNLSKKWRAQIWLNSKYYHIGLFNDIKDAARAYNEAAIKYHGEFANLNKID